MGEGDPPIRKIPPDPARDARRAAYRARERAKISKAFDRYLGDVYGDVYEERFGIRPRVNVQDQDDEGEP